MLLFKIRTKKKIIQLQESINIPTKVDRVRRMFEVTNSNKTGKNESTTFLLFKCNLNSSTKTHELT